MTTTTAFGKNLAALQERKRLTRDEIARTAGVTGGAVTHWMSGRSLPKQKYIDRLADYYGVTVDDLISLTNGLYAQLHGLTDAPAGAITPKEPRKAYAPLYGKVHAGDAEEPTLLDAQIPIPYEVWEHHKQGYFLEVVGTCMNKVYPEGCYVFIDPAKTPQNGSIAVVSIDSEDFIMRRLHKGATALLLSPESNDPSWEDIVITGDAEVRMVGVVVWYQPKQELE